MDGVGVTVWHKQPSGRTDSAWLAYDYCDYAAEVRAEFRADRQTDEWTVAVSFTLNNNNNWFSDVLLHFPRWLQHPNYRSYPTQLEFVFSLCSQSRRRGSTHLRLLSLSWDEVDAMSDLFRVKPQDFLFEQAFLGLTAASWHRLIKLKSWQWEAKQEQEERLEVAHLAAIIGVFCHPQDGERGGMGRRRKRSKHLLCWDIAQLAALEGSWRGDENEIDWWKMC